jgi:hypothetical protein
LLLHQGWKRNIPPAWSGKSHLPFKELEAGQKGCARLVGIISTLICETEEEYFLSKSLLFANLQPSNVHKLVGAVIQDAISNFIKMCIEPYKATFVYYYSRSCRSYLMRFQTQHKKVPSVL